MPRSTVSRALLVLVVVCLAPLAARGDAKNDLDEAKRQAKQAAVHYELGRFQQAADEYSRSYELVPTPGLLFDLAQCEMGLKDYEKSIFFFEGYLRDKPDAPNIALVHDLIAESHRELATEQARRDAAEAARIAASKPPQPIIVAPPPPPPRDPRWMPAFALGGTGAVFVGAALYLGLHADQDLALEHLTAKASPTHALYARDGRDLQIAAGVTGGVGGVALIASGVLGYLALRKHHPAHVAVLPTSRGAVLTAAF